MSAPSIALGDIRFEPAPPTEHHPRHDELRRLEGLQDFAAYREPFECLWVERALLAGQGVRLMDVPVAYTEPTTASPQRTYSGTWGPVWAS